MIAPLLFLALLPLPQGFTLEPGQRAVVEPGQEVVVEPGRRVFGLSGAQRGEAEDGEPQVLLLAPTQQAQGRAWIGVVLATEDDDGPGVAIGSVSEGSPAERAGLQPGDRLVALAGKRLQSYEDLIARLGELRPGQAVPLVLRRSLVVGLDRRGWGEDEGPRLGVSLTEREADRGTALVVTEANEGWPAAAAGVEPGDRLVAANGQELASFERLQEMLRAVEPGHELRLVVERRVRLELGASPQAEAPVPGRGFFLEAPQPDRDLAPDIRPAPGEPRWRVAPVPQPRGDARAPQGQAPGELADDLRALRRELRALREELAALRQELEELRRSRDR